MASSGADLGLVDLVPDTCSPAVRACLRRVEDATTHAKNKNERRTADDGFQYTQEEYTKKFRSPVGWAQAKKPDEGSKPKWTVKEAVGPSLGDLVAELLTPPSIKDDTEGQLAFFRGLGAEGTAEAIGTLLDNQRLLGKLSEKILSCAQALSTSAAATGQEMNSKFAAEGAFEMSFGTKADFFNGLEPRIGSPSPQILKTMRGEHCDGADASMLWTTGNYGITTSARQEWLLVAGEVVEEVKAWSGPKPQEWEAATTELEKGAAERPGVWPAETMNNADPSHGRAAGRSRNFLKEMDSINTGLCSMGEKALLLEETLGLRLYTGPLFEKYNAVNRGGDLQGKRHEVMEKNFLRLCSNKGMENHYTTTIFVITSGLLKASKLTKAVTVYRGMNGGMLPKRFWEADETGVRGGTEFGFMSTTTNRSVAFQYASSQGAGTILEMSTGMIDKGADLAWISQYPHERELCFPPLTSMEVTATRVEGLVLVISIRLNLNLTIETIEELVSKRRKIVSDMCTNLKKEALEDLDKTTELVPISSEIAEKIGSCMTKVSTQQLDDYNNDSQFLELVREGFRIRQSIRWLKLAVQVAEDGGQSPPSSTSREAVESLRAIGAQTRCFGASVSRGYDMLTNIAADYLGDLRSVDAATRQAACVQLRTLPTVDPDVVPAVARLLTDKTAVAREAEETLTHMRRSQEDHVESTLQFMSFHVGQRNSVDYHIKCHLRIHNNAALREKASEVWQKSSEVAAEYAELFSADEVTRQGACEHLRTLPTVDPDVVLAVARLLTNERAVAKEAEETLTHIRKSQKDHVESTVELMLGHPDDPSVRQKGLEVLLRWSVESFDDNWVCQRGIGEIKPVLAATPRVVRPHLAFLAEVLADKSQDEYARRLACKGLGAAGWAAAPYMATLVAVAKDPGDDWPVRGDACKAIGAAGEVAREQLAVLASLAGDGTVDSSVRHGACQGLGIAGELALEHLPTLRRIASQWSEYDHEMCQKITVDCCHCLTCCAPRCCAFAKAGYTGQDYDDAYQSVRSGWILCDRFVNYSVVGAARKAVDKLDRIQAGYKIEATVRVRQELHSYIQGSYDSYWRCYRFEEGPLLEVGLQGVITQFDFGYVDGQGTAHVAIVSFGEELGEKRILVRDFDSLDLLDAPKAPADADIRVADIRVGQDSSEQADTGLLAAPRQVQIVPSAIGRAEDGSPRYAWP